jgi:hypothetical protein
MAEEAAAARSVGVSLYRDFCAASLVGLFMFRNEYSRWRNSEDRRQHSNTK